MGTGAGFPGMPLAILCPQTEFVLLDALRKRIDFLNEVITELGLTLSLIHILSGGVPRGSMILNSRTGLFTSQNLKKSAFFASKSSKIKPAGKNARRFL